MKLYNDLTTVEVKEEFENVFPGLKIEFYRSAHEDHEGSSIKEQINQSVPLAQLELKTEADVQIDPSWSVAHFEQLMENEYGLHIQVFRRSNDLWLQTSVTDDWTLETQNGKGLRSVQT